MSSFILRQSPAAPVSVEEAARSVRGRPGLALTGRTTRMLRVEGPEPAIRSLLDQLEGWSGAPETRAEMPDPRPRIERPGE